MLKRTLSASLLLAALALVGLSQKRDARPELTSLVEAERAFSKLSVEKGARAAFLEFLADEGIKFSPHPVNGKEQFRSRPAPSGPPPFTLSWEPVFADVSRAGDLGYTTGPFVLSDNSRKRPSQHGYYFSIWGKQGDGSWKVLLDTGTGNPAPADPARAIPFRGAPASRWKPGGPSAGAEEVRARLLQLERELSALSSQRGVTGAYRHFLAVDARMHVDGLMPLTDKSSIISFLTGKSWREASFEPLASGAARSADTGYTYGKYQLKGASPAAERGYFVRVWKRDPRGDWKIVADILSPLPEEQK